MRSFMPSSIGPEAPIPKLPDEVPSGKEKGEGKKVPKPETPARPSTPEPLVLKRGTPHPESDVKIMKANKAAAQAGIHSAKAKPKPAPPKALSEYGPFEMTRQEAFRLLECCPDPKVGIFIKTPEGKTELRFISRNSSGAIVHNHYEPIDNFPKKVGLIEGSLKILTLEDVKNIIRVEKKKEKAAAKQAALEKQRAAEEVRILDVKHYVLKLLEEYRKTNNIKYLFLACELIVVEDLKILYPKAQIKIEHLELVEGNKFKITYSYKLKNEEGKKAVYLEGEKIRKWLYVFPGLYQPLSITKAKAQEILLKFGSGRGLFRWADDGSQGVVYTSLIQQGIRETLPLLESSIPANTRSFQSQGSFPVSPKDVTEFLEREEKLAAGLKEMETKLRQTKQTPDASAAAAAAAAAAPPAAPVVKPQARRMNEAERVIALKKEMLALFERPETRKKAVMQYCFDQMRAEDPNIKLNILEISDVKNGMYSITFEFVNIKEARIIGKRTRFLLLEAELEKWLKTPPEQ